MGTKRFRITARFWMFLAGAAVVLLTAITWMWIGLDKSSPGSETKGVDSAILAPGETDDPDYLQDILFIGDSRTLGLSSYGRLPAGQVLAVDGMNHKTAREERCVEWEGDLLTMAQAAGEIRPKRIVVAFGINGMAFMSGEEFIDEYERLLNDIQRHSPGSMLIVESILPVTKAFEEAQPDMSNAIIRERNQQILRLAEEKGYHYLNIAEAMSDDEDCLDEKYAAGDGLHLKPSAYDVILDYVKNHPAPQTPST